MTTPDFSGAAWRKSNRSQGNGGECVEVAWARDATWRKTSRSQGNGGDCVEVAFALPAVGVRDSKNTAGPILAFPATAWHIFVRAR